jgi:predicted DCC family thiol-disulfide oxidoreductase YuxK
MLNQNSTIVFIDDDCIFCNYWGEYIIKNDKSDSIFISPSTSNIFTETKKKFTLFPNPKETIILYHNGRIYSKSLAVIKISVLMKNWQSIMSFSYIIPKFIRDFFYDIISRNRKSIMLDSCVIDELKRKDKYIV